MISFQPGRGTNAARISRPSSVRIGMFCRFGFDDESRPVAAPVWLNVVCSRAGEWIDQHRQRVHIRALQFRELPVLQNFPAMGYSADSASSTSAAVEIVLPLPYLTGAGSFKSSNNTFPSCCGELMLKVFPASS